MVRSRLMRFSFPRSRDKRLLKFNADSFCFAVLHRKYKKSGKFSDKNIMDNSLSEYELLRLRNIKTKHEFMKSLGEL